jgi:hypothetical protein
LILLATLLAFALSISGLQADLQARDARAIAVAKNTSVHRLDPSLLDKPLAKWLREVVGQQVPIAWEVNDCGEQTGNPESDKGRDFPMCAEAQATLKQKVALVISVSVGTLKTGVQPDSVSLAYAVVNGPGGSTRFVHRLSQVPKAIEAAP